MQSKSTSWRLTLWIACFAILMNALAPSISHAMGAMGRFGAGPASWDICRADRGAQAAPAKKITQDTMASMDDCGYCLPHAGSHGLLPSTISGLGLMKGHALRPYLFYRAPQPLLALSAAPPRGPPARAALA